MAFEKILVPLDGSDLAERALPYAQTIAKTRGSSILLLAVLGPGERLERPMKAYLEAEARRLESQGISSQASVISGNPAEEIVRFADDHEVSLIVISSHGYSGIRRWMPGSVALKVLYGTCVPTLLVKSKSPEVSPVKFQKVLLPIDGSPFSETSLLYAEELLQGTGTELLLLRVTEPPVVTADRSPAIKPSWEEYRDQLMAEVQQQALAYLEKVKSGFEQKGLKARSQAVLGKAVESILEVARAEEVDLIIMTTHGRTGVSRWVYGSVANRVMEECRHPILLIRPCPPEEPKI